MNRVAVIGSGFSGLSAACFLASDGFEVTLLEKNESLGGRARKFSAQGFTFDMDTSWYWMPDCIREVLSIVRKKTSDYYSLQRLDPPIASCLVCVINSIYLQISTHSKSSFGKRTLSSSATKSFSSKQFIRRSDTAFLFSARTVC